MAEITLWDKTLQLIEKFGLSLTLLVLLIFWLRPKLNQMWDLMIKQAGKQSHETVEDVVAMSTCIRTALQDMMSDFRADWCHLWQFHNGIRSMGTRGLPFLYITLTHEVKKTGLATLIPAFEHIPLSMFDDFATDLIDGDILEFSKPIPNTEKLENLIIDYGVETIMIRAIRDEDGGVVAFISCSWKEKKEITDIDRKAFRAYGQRMSATLARLPDEVLVKC